MLEAVKLEDLISLSCEIEVAFFDLKNRICAIHSMIERIHDIESRMDDIVDELQHEAHARYGEQFHYMIKKLVSMVDPLFRIIGDMSLPDKEYLAQKINEFNNSK